MNKNTTTLTPQSILDKKKEKREKIEFKKKARNEAIEQRKIDAEELREKQEIERYRSLPVNMGFFSDEIGKIYNYANDLENKIFALYYNNKATQSLLISANQFTEKQLNEKISKLQEKDKLEAEKRRISELQEKDKLEAEKKKEES